MKKIAFLIILFYSINLFSFNSTTIIDEIFDSNGCRISVNLQFEITNYNSNSTYQVWITSDSDDIAETISLPNVNSNGFHTTGLISINERTTFMLMERKIYYVILVPIIIPIPHFDTSITILHCQNDIDSDGVLNVDDICPNEYGNANNFGCFGNPDLTIDEKLSWQYSDCSNCNNPIENSNDPNYKPTIYRFGGNITINPLVVKNIGDGDPHIGSIKIRFYLSQDTTISSDDLGFGNRTVVLTPPKAGESTPESGPSSYGVSIEGTDIGNSRNYGNYYLIIIIDEPNKLDGSEINLNNNISIIPVKYTNVLPSNRPSKIKVELFDLNARSVINYEVYDEQEAKSKINSLNIKEGLYFVKLTQGKLTKNIKVYKKKYSF